MDGLDDPENNLKPRVLNSQVSFEDGSNYSTFFSLSFPELSFVIEPTDRTAQMNISFMR